MPLRLSDGNLSVLNRWARRIEYDTVNRGGRTFAKIVKVTPEAPDEVVPDTTIPPMPTNVIAAESGRTVSGTVYSDVYCAYTAPNPKGSFVGIYLVASGYKGASLVKIGEHSYAGAPGGNASFSVTLDRTNETITLYFVPKNNVGGTPADWLTCPSTTVTLDGATSKPLPPRNLQLTSFESGIALVWTENIEPDVTTYQVYRSDTATDFATATKLADVAATHQTTNTYTDSTADPTKPHAYWVVAVNSAVQNSDPSEAETFNVFIGRTNEVINGGFEKWLLCWNVPANVTWVNDSTKVQSGIGCAEVAFSGAGTVTLNHRDSWGNAYYIPIDTWDAFMRVWCNVYAVTGNVSITATIRQYSAAKGLLNTAVRNLTLFSGSTMVPLGTWSSMYTITDLARIPSAVYAQIDLTVTATGAATVRLDNARFQTFTPVIPEDDPTTR